MRLCSAAAAAAAEALFLRFRCCTTPQKFDLYSSSSKAAQQRVPPPLTLSYSCRRWGQVDMEGTGHFFLHYYYFRTGTRRRSYTHTHREGERVSDLLCCFPACTARTKSLGEEESAAATAFSSWKTKRARIGRRRWRLRCLLRFLR